MNNDPDRAACAVGGTPDFEPVEERTGSGRASVVVEIVCERVHCVMYDYAINTVDMVAEEFGDRIEIQTVIRRGGIRHAARFLQLCKKAKKLLSVPTILINVDVLFTTVPLPEELAEAIQSYLDKETENRNTENKGIKS